MCSASGPPTASIGDLAAGRSVQLKTDLGPMNANTARRYAAVVRDARLVE